MNGSTFEKINYSPKRRKTSQIKNNIKHKIFLYLCAYVDQKDISDDDRRRKAIKEEQEEEGEDVGDVERRFFFNRTESNKNDYVKRKQVDQMYR